MKVIISMLSLLFYTGSNFAQTNVDDVVSKVIEAQGGKEKLLAIKTVIMKGNIEFSGQKIPINMYFLNKKAQRTEYSFSGLTSYSIVTNDSGFNFNPFQGQTAPENMTAEDVQLAQCDLDQSGVLVNYKEKGYSIELLENEDVDGVDAIQLKISILPNKTQYFFIDPSNYYVIRIKNVLVSNGQQIRNSVDFYNFKKTKEGVLFPFTFDNITFDSIELNEPVDEKLFKPVR